MELEDRIDRYITDDMDPAEKASFEHEMSCDKNLEKEVELFRLLRVEIIGQKMISDAKDAFDVERDDAIDRYLLREMTDKEKADFEENLTWDEELKAEVESRKVLITGVRLEKIEEKLKEMEPGAAASAGGGVGRRLGKIAASIAIFATMCGGGLSVYSYEWAKSVGNDEWELLANARSVTPDYVESVDRGAYKEAIAIIDDMPLLSDDEKYDKALILLKQGKKREAKKILNEINDERSRKLLEKLSIW